MGWPPSSCDGLLIQRRLCSAALTLQSPKLSGGRKTAAKSCLLEQVSEERLLQSLLQVC